MSAGGLDYNQKIPELGEDELARIQEIFKAFDQGEKGRVLNADLPFVLRLLNYNIYE